MTNLYLNEQIQLTAANTLQKEIKQANKNIHVVNLDYYRQVGMLVREHLNLEDFADVNKVDSRIKYAVFFGTYEENNMFAIPLTNNNLKEIIKKCGIISTVKCVPRITAPAKIKVAGYAAGILINRYPQW